MRKLLKFAIALAALSALPFPARAQFIGFVGLQTVSQKLASSATCTGSAQSFVVPNLGQVSHQASALSSAASFTMEIDAGDNITATYRISNPQVSFANAGSVSYIAQGYGYYAVTQIVVTCTSSATFSLSYSGSQTAFSPVIGPPGGSPVNVGPGTLNEVQGIVPQGSSSGSINPVLEGGVAPAINSGFTTPGLDNFSTGTAVIPNGTVQNVNEAQVPPLQQNGQEFALAFDAHSGNGSTQTTSLVAPWTALGFSNCNGTGTPAVCAATLSNATAGQLYQRNYGSSGAQAAHTDMVGILTFTGTSSAAARQGNVANAATVALSSNSLAGSTLAASVVCTTATCTGIGLTDTQGNVWKPVVTFSLGSGNPYTTLSLWVSTTLTTAAADSLTFTSTAGTIFASQVVELTGLSASNLTFPSTFVSVDPLGNHVMRLDAQAPNQIACNVTLSTNTTTQLTGCGAPATINNQPVRIYVTDIQVNTTTAGTASIVQPKTGTGTNCGTGTANLSAITYSTATAGLQNALGFRTPLVAPLQSAVCFTQSGTAAATVTIEVHGFLAP